MTNSSIMRAAVLEEYNSALRLMEMARPKAEAGQVLVRIKASGVNPLDTKIRTGNGGHAKQPLPAVLGMDLAGIVEEVGAGVTGFRIGEEVYGMAGGVGCRDRWRSLRLSMRSYSRSRNAILGGLC